MKMKMTHAAAILFAMAADFARAAVVSLPEVAPSTFPDSESSSFREIAFELGSVVSLVLACPTTPTNCAEIVLGRDSNLDDYLDWDEAALKLGWNAGDWFVSSPASGEECFANMAGCDERGNLVLSMRLDSRGRVVLPVFSASGAAVPADIAPVAEAVGDASMWNALRVVTRGSLAAVSVRVRSRRDGSMFFVK